MENANSAKQNFFQNSKKVRMTHFNVTVALKCRQKNNSNDQNM